MNTYIRLEAYGDKAADALSQAQERIEELESLWSTTDENSEIYAVNHSDGHPVAVSADTAAVVSFALEMAEKTGGALEPTIHPVRTAWGFTTEKHRVPEQEEINRLLATADYRNVSIDGNEIQLGTGMMMDLGAVGKGIRQRRDCCLTSGGRCYLCTAEFGRQYYDDWFPFRWK